MVAAGSGKRIGGPTPKQFRILAGRPVILHTVLCLTNIREIRKIIIVTDPTDRAHAKALLSSAEKKTPLLFVPGGRTRQDSVWCGIRMIDDSCNLVLIHDAVRPLASSRLIRRCVRAATKFGASVPAVPVRDTIKEVSRSGMVSQTIPRERLQEIQTPQVFEKALLLNAYRRARRDGFYASDDSALVERAGGTVKVVHGEPWNIKITFPSDLIVAEALLQRLLKTQTHASLNR